MPHLAIFGRLLAPPLPPLARRISRLLPLLLLAFALAGCAAFDRTPPPNPNAPRIVRAPVVEQTGRKAAVLSVHVKKEFPDACTFGMTMTNNLDTRVTSLSLRLGAYLENGVMFDQITRNFHEVRPTDSQYREVTFTRIRCADIAYLGVSDPGRCAIGEDTRFTTTEGDCLRYIDLAEGPLVTLRKQAQPRS